MTDKPGYYGIIPATVRYDKRLKPAAKLLYTEITALTTSKGYCFATNQYFAELYEVSTRAVQGWIQQLADCGYIDIRLNKLRNERKIYIQDTPARDEENFVGVRKNVRGGTKKNSPPHEKKFAHSIKDSNTDSIKNNTHTQREKIGNPDLSQTTDSPEIQSPKTPPVAPPPPVVEKHVNNPDPVEIITSKILSNDMYLDRWRNLNGLPDETITAEARKCARNWIGRNCIGLSDSDVVYNANRTGAFIFISRFESWVAQMDKYNAPPQPKTKPVKTLNKYGV